MTNKVLITGAMGFIGGHTAKVFKESGYTVYGVDHYRTIPEAEQYIDHLYLKDFVDSHFLAFYYGIDTIVHCAGSSLVGPSILDPFQYYWNNCSKTNDFLEGLKSRKWQGTLIFSSSAAVYGIPKNDQPLVESDPKEPISPYGRSKLVCEGIIRDHCYAHKFKGIALRYFNAAGCDADGKIGHVADDTHMIPRVLSAYQNGLYFGLYGNDYNTRDGTCVRDYLHVTDIARAHLEAACLAETLTPGSFQAFNLGTKTGTSNKEIIDTCKRIVNDDIMINQAERRIGDPDFLVADSTPFQELTSWKPINSDIENIVRTAWNWQKKLPLTSRPK